MAVSPEPIAHWQQLQGFNLLAAYYQDPHRWAYSFQNYALLTRMNQLHRLLQDNDPRPLFSERSVIADRHIFAELLYRQGKMAPIEYQLYLRAFEDLSRLHQPQPIHKHFYLRTQPERCRQRIEKRGRAEEATVSLEYLRSIHQLHEEWLTDAIVLDGTLEFENDEKRLAELVEQIQLELQKPQQQ